MASTATIAQFSEFGGGVGATNIRSDLGLVSLPNTRWGVNGFYRWNLSHIWVMRLEAKYVNAASSDSYYDYAVPNARNYSFKNNMLEVSANMEYNFLNFRYLKDEHRWCPFLTAGFGNYGLFATSYDDKADFFNFSIPIGFGVKFKLSDYWNLGFIYTASKTFNDKIDGISQSEPSEMSVRIRATDEATNDWFHYAGFTISYTLYRLRCPKHLEEESAPEYWQRHFR